VAQGKEGLAEITADLLREGTETRDALKLAGELSEIGASLNSFGGLESCGLSLLTLTRHEAKAIELFVDVLLNPSFPEKDLERLRKQKLAGLARRADSAGGIARVVYPRLVYGLGHPYGRIDSISSVKGLGRDDIVQFYKKVFLPNNSAIVVAGDTTPDEITAKLEQALAGWKPGDAPEWHYPEPPASKTLALYLVDKPAAAQSVLTAGHVGVPRNTPDYFALEVMNGVLGGQFSSRLNLNLREDKGYTYGARSRFDFRQGPGPFEASTSVQTAVTKEALAELVKEIKDITASRPVTTEELAFAKDRLKKGFPARFDTTFGLSGALSQLVEFHLPDDYFTTYQSKVEAVTKDEVDRVARKYLDPEHLAILVVGDRKLIEAKLKELPYAQGVNVLDIDGNPLSSAGSDAAASGGGHE
jgi:zinc protease